MNIVHDSLLHLVWFNLYLFSFNYVWDQNSILPFSNFIEHISTMGQLTMSLLQIGCNCKFISKFLYSTHVKKDQEDTQSIVRKTSRRCQSWIVTSHSKTVNSRLAPFIFSSFMNLSKWMYVFIQTVRGVPGIHSTARGGTETSSAPGKLLTIFNTILLFGSCLKFHMWWLPMHTFCMKSFSQN